MSILPTLTTVPSLSDQETGRLLIVDDDPSLCDLLTLFLTKRNFQVDSERDGTSGLQTACRGGYDLIILDVMLPGVDGFEILRRLRAGNDHSAHTPILMLSAHGDEVDRIVGLELGADDYLCKPFNTRELLARIRAILRRSPLVSTLIPPPVQERSKSAESEPNQVVSFAPRMAPSMLCDGDLEVDCGARTVHRLGQLLALTATEFNLLVLLLSDTKKIVTREEIARDVLNRQLLPFDRSLDMHISKLRRKLGPSAKGAERIKTVRCIGYIYVKEKAI